MKTVLLIILACFSLSASAVGVYKQPAIVMFYTEQGLTLKVTTMIRTQVTAYGSSEMLSVAITNNTLYSRVFTVDLQDALGNPSSVFAQDSGCNAVVAPKATCTMLVTYTPAQPSPDGTVQVEDDKFILSAVTVGATVTVPVVSTYTIEGLGL